MKRTLQVICVLGLLACSTTGWAQIRQYSVLVGGSMGGMYQISGKNDINKQNIINYRISASPRGGVFLLEQFAIGMGIDYSYQNRKIKGDKVPEFKRSVFTAGPFVRYYLPNLLFAEVFAGVGLQNTVDRKNPDDEIKSDLLHLTAGVGYAYFINGKVAVEPQIRYVYDTEELRNNVREKRHGVEFLVGFQIYLYHDKLVLYKQ